MSMFVGAKLGGFKPIFQNSNAKSFKSHHNIFNFTKFSTLFSASRLVGQVVNNESTSDYPLSLQKYIVGKQVIVPLQFTIPTFKYGLWRKPKLNNRKLKLIKQKSELHGLEFVDPRPPKEKKENPENFQRTPKGHRWEEKKEEREKTIKKKMKEMPKLIEDYRTQFRKHRETQFKPLSLFWNEPILEAPRRLSKRKSVAAMRAERKLRKKIARAQRKAQADKAASGESEEKKKKKKDESNLDNKGIKEKAEREQIRSIFDILPKTL